MGCQGTVAANGAWCRLLGYTTITEEIEGYTNREEIVPFTTERERDGMNRLLKIAYVDTGNVSSIAAG